MKTLGLILFLSSFSFALDLRTKAEKTAWKETGRYEEVIHLCRAFQRTYPEKARCEKFGVTPEGRPLHVLIITETGTFSPITAQRKNIPVILFQGGIHSGEIDGKDAGFWLLKDILADRVAKQALKKMILVFVPVFNVDGHERFTKNNRPNQVGPEEMGWRTTSQNLNLNRDYMKAESPEMIAMLKLLGKWKPIVYLDLHVTDGAQFRHEVAVIVKPSLKGPETLRVVGEKISNAIQKDLAEFNPVPFYPSFVKDDEPESGFELYFGVPRFSDTYWGFRSRIGILVETHSWQPYARRVLATRNTLLSVIEQARVEGKHWLTVASDTEKAVAKSTDKEVLTYENSPKSRMIEFLGYAYEKIDSPVIDKPVIRYNTTKPVTWKVPLFYELIPKLTVTPLEAYVVPPAHANWVAEKLKIHGISYTLLKDGKKAVPISQFETKAFDFNKEPFEGRMGMKLEGAWEKPTLRSLLPGSLWVPVNQAAKLIVLHLFEPEAPDSYLSWGFFNAHFERKEYIETYVLEPWARDQMDKNPALKAEFEKKLNDEEFETNEEARLNFFYDRHPARDKQYAVYPILRVGH